MVKDIALNITPTDKKLISNINKFLNHLLIAYLRACVLILLIVL